MKRMSSSLRAKEEFLMMCREGEFKAGDRLPSEMKMAQKFGVSRETWRASLELLRREGIIYSKHGVGTFLMEVSAKMENDLTRLCAVSDMIRQAGIAEGPSTYTTGLTIPSHEIAAALNVKSGINVFYINRTRCAKNGAPICCSMHYIPVYLADELDPMHMPDSLFTYFERRKGIFVSRSSAHLLIPQYNDPLAAQLRGDDNTMQILGMEQQHFDSRGNPVLYTVDYLRSEVFNFSVTRIREK
ncbi:MAG: GntR family transcriptional regulator [Eubacteriales bacterium]|nr:GntR family transcriptional regulator [Eubacteriales bacterium]